MQIPADDRDPRVTVLSLGTMSSAFEGLERHATTSANHSVFVVSAARPIVDSDGRPDETAPTGRHTGRGSSKGFT
ncbi:hypothetical protein PH30N_10196 [Cutibacterium modestum 30N]|nr:hypothetical protein BCB70_02915 [Cutibacterium modestum]EGG27314.1 hypothetical protein PA08_1558 [Cutibacterium modestum P08]MCP2376107.1 hypothetical protein [Cutibacterium modestum 28N]MCP2378147.1 hypothetical protein [Cutibacterium modestum 31N]MCP2381327.1 hypothetical protein [Cutibacterium modestum 30N]